MKVLAIGTFPIRLPIHGGQRRSHQIGAYYERAGMTFRYASIYSPAAYSTAAVSEFDYPYAPVGGIYSEIPFIDDLGSGVFAASQDGPYDHFRHIVEEFQPDVIQLDQPFMWPLFDRLQREGYLRGVKLVYSSYNVEAPLKADILENAGIARAKVSLVAAMIDQLEREVVTASDLVIAVSSADAEQYRQMDQDVNAIVIRNGTERSIGSSRPSGGKEMLQGRFLFFVGSAYPPNIEGFAKYVLGPSLYGVPPEKLIAVCGGAADGIYQSAEYLPHAESYGDRVHFFSRLTDDELAWIKGNAKGTILPIATGGGSNLKTAEALSSGKWVVATPMAMRSFEDFMDEPGVLVADTPEAFVRAMLDVLHGEPLVLSASQVRKREALFWDKLLDASGLGKRVMSLASSKYQSSRA